jgi:tetratricopeptide (TPR) repeat protein
VSTSGDGSALAKLLDSILDDPLEEGALGAETPYSLTSSFEIFIGAAALALEANQWRLADHFCEVAINAFRYFAKYENITDLDAAEAHYLCALAKRFRLAEIRPKQSVVPYSSATKLYEKAIDLLRKSEQLSGHVGTGFQSYRAYSERAALSLFFATLCNEIASELPLEEGRVPARAARKAYQDAGAYLSEALRVEQRSGFGNVHPQMYGDHSNRIRLQILINISAWYALRPIVDPEGTENHPDLARECARNLGLLELALERIKSPLFDLELLAFKISQNIDADRSRRLLTNRATRPPVGLVHLDHTVIAALSKHWGTRESGPSERP